MKLQSAADKNDVTEIRNQLQRLAAALEKLGKKEQPKPAAPTAKKVSSTTTKKTLVATPVVKVQRRRVIWNGCRYVSVN